MIEKLSASGSDKPLTPAMEDYLEAIFDLEKEKKVVRVKDIAKQLNVKMPTVTSMLKVLRDRNMVAYEKYEYVELTPEGEVVGKEIDRRHRILKRFLVKVLKVNGVQANEEACMMEHAVSQSTLEKLVDFMEFIQTCPRTGASWLERFDEFRVQGRRPDTCQKETAAFAEELKRKAAHLEAPEGQKEKIT
jgi:DtxR family Mn-dependent transcriptional regulator